MGAMKDLSIEIDEAVHLFEAEFRNLGTVGGSEAVARANAYDAFWDLKGILDRVLGSGDQTPTPNDSVYNTFYVEDDDTIRGQLRELSAQVAALAAAQAGQSEEAISVPEEVPSDEKYSTGQTLHITMYDGSTYSIENVDSFHLSLDKTSEWPVGWVVGDDPDAEPKAGYWGDDAEFHAFDSRYRTPGFRGGW